MTQIKKSSVTKNQKGHSVELELITRKAKSSSPHPPILFIHGAYVGAWCWEEFFLDFFVANNFDCYALSLRGHGKSEGFGSMLWTGLDDYLDDIIHIIEKLEEPPIIVAHSMGGMVAQKYLEQFSCHRAVLMATVPYDGLAMPAFSLALRNPFHFCSFLTTRHIGPNMLTPCVAQNALFHKKMTPKKAQQYLSRMQSVSVQALHDMTWLKLPRKFNPHNTPMLVLAAEKDALFSVESQRKTAEVHGAEFDLMPDMAHAMMLDPEWRSAANRILHWLNG